MDVMDIFLLILAVLTLAFVLVTGLQLALGNRSVKYLKDIVPSDEASPKVSIIVPARNEQEKIEPALISLLKQDYPNLEIIVVNDRSTDSTGEILRNISSSYTNIKVITLSELPEKWLGKNYALHDGSQHASGDYLLFTDADVTMAPSTISKAVYYIQTNQIDHLVCSPVVKVQGKLLTIMIGTFLYLFIMATQPWKASNPDSKKFIGIGAFNFVKSDVYRKIGTHEAIRMRPDDDMMLGKRLKRMGYKQDILNGTGMIELEWYSSCREMVGGLMKNAFAGVNYNVANTIMATLFLFLFFIFPCIGVFYPAGIAPWLYGLILIGSTLSYQDNAGFFKLKKWSAIALPVGVAGIIYILCKSTLLALINGGINWRDTHYSLKDLKANKVSFH